MTAWTSMYHAMHARDEKGAFSRATLRRILAFALPHRRQLTLFLVLSVVAAVLTVATPVLAGRVVNAIVAGSDFDVVLRLALLIALIAIADAGIGLLTDYSTAKPGPGVAARTTAGPTTGYGGEEPPWQELDRQQPAREIHL